ncbi:hypothetical protein BDC45DRAFT_524753 [Circinella umbellata]|nr:hypothetical protein BDC45DRAFT_524753 [Circinella umbellata]
MWLPMTRKERSRCIRWRIGWLPGGKPKTCMTCLSSHFTKQHSIQCLQMHKRLKIHISKTDDSLSYILNRLPKSKPSSASRIQWLQVLWPIVCTIVAELDAHQHPTFNLQQYHNENLGQALLTWINPAPPELTR